MCYNYAADPVDGSCCIGESLADIQPDAFTYRQASSGYLLKRACALYGAKQSGPVLEYRLARVPWHLKTKEWLKEHGDNLKSDV
jgi:hypothetical protein